MSQKGLKGTQVRKTSSPNKVYKSRASKPSGVDEITTADADATYGSEERDLINELKAKYNELLEALKK